MTAVSALGAGRFATRSPDSRKTSAKRTTIADPAAGRPADLYLPPR
jgi:hypothetical protein